MNTITPANSASTLFRPLGWTEKEIRDFDHDSWGLRPPVLEEPFQFADGFSNAEWDAWLQLSPADRAAREARIPPSRTPRETPLVERFRLHPARPALVIAPQPDHAIGRRFDPRLRQVVYCDAGLEDKPRWWRLGPHCWGPIIVSRPGEHLLAARAALELHAQGHAHVLWIGEVENPEPWRRFASRRGIDLIREFQDV